MVMLSPEARARASRTVTVAAVFADHAEAIAEAVAYVPEGFVLVAVVDEEYVFTGVHQVSTDDLVEQVPALEQSGWAMVFSPGADADHVRTRTMEMADIARQRIEMIDRINARRAGAAESAG